MLEIDNLKVALDSEAGLVRAIDGLRLALRRGETFALVGESGCGKSMTALALMRLLPENGRVTGGEIRLDGEDVLALAETGMRAIRGGKIGMIFQEPGTSLNPVMRVGDQIVEAIETHTPLRGAAARERAVEWLRKVGIPEPERRVDDYPFRMSGGQKQRVMIAMTLAAEPDFLVADEPTTALDVTIQAQILDLMRALRGETGASIILITHDLGVVAEMAHRVVVMYAGRKVEEASVGDLFARPLHPYTRGLLGSMPHLGASLGEHGRQRLTEIPGIVPSLREEIAGCAFAPRCTYATERCRRELPVLDEHRAGHLAACWEAARLPAYEAAAAAAHTVPIHRA